MTEEIKHMLELELSEKHLVLLECIAKKTMSSASDIARELLEDNLNQLNQEDELWVVLRG